MGKIANLILKGAASTIGKHVARSICTLIGVRERRGIERRKGGRLSERQNVVVLSAFLRRRRKRGDSLDPAQDNLQMHFDFLSLNLGAIALIARESRKTD